MSEIPTSVLRPLFKKWRKSYGITFPLYGAETVRHDISGSIRPLLPSTEISHEKVLAERSGVPLKEIQKILNGERETVTEMVADRLLIGMDMPDAWFNELSEWYT
jgi:transcriptional regulator with XRE-family HTH domain